MNLRRMILGLWLMLLSPLSLSQQPTIDYASFLNMKFYATSGGFLIDDLQYAEPEGRHLVLSIARAIGSHRVLLVAAARPGLPDDEYERYMLEEKGVFADVRKSEARYLPLKLKEALETSGYWGAVRLVPASHVIDLRVGGLSWKSNGKKLEVDIKAIDARGKEWLDKRYKAEANPLAYADKETEREPFQDLYNKIAKYDLQKGHDG